MSVTESDSAPEASLGGTRAPEERAVRSNVYRWYAVGILAVIFLVGTVDRLALSVVIEPLKAEFLLSDTDIGLLSMAYSVAFSLVILPSGWLVDRMERRMLLSVAVAVWSFLTAACAFGSNFLLLALVRMGVGAAEGPAHPASMSLIADMVPKRRRTTAVSIYVVGSGVGETIVFIAGGWILMHFDWRGVFLLAGVPGLVMAALLRFTTREPKRGAFDEAAQREQAKPATAKEGFREICHGILGNAALCYALIAVVLATGVFYSTAVWGTSFLVRSYGLTVSEASIWTGIAIGPSMIIGSLLVGPFADRFSKGDMRRLSLIPMIATLLGLVGGLTMTLAGTLPLALAGFSFLSLMTGFFYTAGESLVLSLSPPRLRGTTIAVSELLPTFIGNGPIPLITGAMSDAIGGPGSIRSALLCTMMILVLAVLSYMRVYQVRANSLP
jgi:MFS family permease